MAGAELAQQHPDERESEADLTEREGGAEVDGAEGGGERGRGRERTEQDREVAEGPAHRGSVEGEYAGSPCSPTITSTCARTPTAARPGRSRSPRRTSSATSRRRGRPGSPSSAARSTS